MSLKLVLWGGGEGRELWGGGGGGGGGVVGLFMVSNWSCKPACLFHSFCELNTGISRIDLSCKAA